MEEKKMSLWQYDNAIKTVIEQGFVCDEETGEIYFTSDNLDSLNNQIDEKLNNIIGYIKECTLEADTLEAKSKAANEVFQKQLDNEYNKPAERLTKKANSLTKYLEGYMQVNNIEEVKKENGIAKYAKSQVCEIVDDSKIKDFCKSHAEYADKFIKIETTISKKEIKDYLKAGNVLDGASLINKKTLKVK